jgi:hypothetical protein
VPHVVVDAANVVGSRPDGWWRDRAGAARRLAGQLVEALVTDPAALAGAVGAGDSDVRVHLVLEGAAARAEDLPEHPALTVHRARADGDSAVVELVGGLGDGERVVVTADRELRERVRAAGATTVGPGALLQALPG